MTDYDTIVIGAGAAGLMAGGTAAACGQTCLIIEKMEKPARKVRITGKGRCNITNTKDIGQFMEKVNAGQPLAEASLRSFDNLKTIAFFESIGLRLATERGERVFPASGKAWDVAESLISWVLRSGAEIRCLTRVVKILTEAGSAAGVIVEDKSGKRQTIRAKKVIIATGGLSYPATGSTGDGLAFAHSLGHNIVEVRPSLVPLEIESWYARALEGAALRNIALRLIVNGECVAEEFGEMEFRDGAASGAIVLRISRKAVDAIIDEHDVALSLDLKPALTPEKLAARIVRETQTMAPNATVKDLLRKLVPEKLTAPVARKANLAPNAPLLKAGRLSADIADAIVKTLKNFKLDVTDYCPFEQAVVTAGGVDTTEIDPQTLESRLIKGLYFAGEVMDIDAQTGGYNLQLAFSTGRKAGGGK